MGTSSATEFQGQSATIMMPILSFIILIISNILIHLRESEMDTQTYIDPHKAKFMFTIYLADKQFFLTFLFMEKYNCLSHSVFPHPANYREPTDKLI